MADTRMAAGGTDAGDAYAELVPLGFSERFQADFAPHALAGLEPGRVARSDRGSLMVLTATGVVRAEVASALLREADARSLPAAGDWAALSRPEGLEHAVVEAVLPRASEFAREDPGKTTVAQVVAANVDTVFIVQGLDRGVNPRRLERELVLAWESGAAPVVVLAKADLAEDVESERSVAEAVAPGVEVLTVSCVTGEGLEALREHVGTGRTAALLGASGVGKSTLVNSLAGADVQATAAVRESDSRGRHTTVARELIPLPGGGVLLDTPGMRAIALWGAEEGVAAAFSDVEALAEGCRFRDCGHNTEPGCAVLEAVAAGELDAARLESYQKLQRELVVLAAKQDARLRSMIDRDWRIISKEAKRLRKERGR